MSLPQDPSPRSSGTEAREAVAAVLQDQAQRAERRDQPGRQPVDRGPLMGVLLLLLLGATVWMLVAPPAFLRPPPLPTPEPAELQAGLRMDIWVAARSLATYRETHGAWPSTLEEALESPEDGADLFYDTLPGGRYRITGQRDGLVVIHESDEPLSRLREAAMGVVRDGGSP